jgi:hypothetical protein
VPRLFFARRNFYLAERCKSSNPEVVEGRCTAWEKKFIATPYVLVLIHEARICDSIILLYFFFF